MWQSNDMDVAGLASLRGHLPAKGRFEVACGRFTFTWRVEGEGRFDVACIAFPFRLGGGGSDVTPGQLIPQVGNSGPLPI